MGEPLTALQESPAPAARAPRRRVVLYNPRADSFTMPLALLALGSNLDPDRYDVTLVDGRLEAAPITAVLAACRDAVCFGVSVLTGPPIGDALAVTRAVRTARPELPVVWGGWHPSLFPVQCVEEAPVDVAIRGQGEAVFAAVVDRLAFGEPPAAVPGCTWRDRDGAIRDNPPRPLEDMNRFRPLRYDLIPMERYFERKGRRQIDYVSSHGCPHRCAHCPNPAVYGRCWTALAPERVADDTLELWKRHGFDDLSFRDEAFFHQPERAAAIAGAFLSRALPVSWSADMRADEGALLPDDAWALCRRSGLRRVGVRALSGDPGILDRMRKDIRPDQVEATAARCLKHGVAADFKFMVGVPGETNRSLQATLRLAARLRDLGPGFRTLISYYRPHPGSTAGERLTPRSPSGAGPQEADPRSADGAGAGKAPGGPAPPLRVAPDRKLEEWAKFSGNGEEGEGVHPGIRDRVEQFRFYQRLAWEPARGWRVLAQRLARWRCRRHQYALPLEMRLDRWLLPPESLS